MSEMFDRVAKAIHDALDKPKYVVKIGKQWELWCGGQCIMTSDNHTKIDDLCDKFNNQNVARKAIEALKEPTDEMTASMLNAAPEVSYDDVYKCYIEAILNEPISSKASC